MGRFCEAHVGERSKGELEARKIALEVKFKQKQLGPGNKRELERIKEELERRVNPAERIANHYDMRRKH